MTYPLYMNMFVFSRRRALALAGASVIAGIARRGLAADQPLKIGAVGSGRVGSALGSVWVKAGHQVMFSSRHPEELKDKIAAWGPNAKAGTVAEAIAFGDVVLLAVPYGALPELGREFAAALGAKPLVMDTCNPFLERDGDVAAQALEKGAGLYTAELLPGSKIVRAFNAIPAAKMMQGGKNAEGVQLGMPIAGDDAKAIEIASALVRETGFEPVLAGSLDFGKNLRPRTPLAGELTPDQIKTIAATLK